MPTSWCPVVVGKPMLIILLGVGVDSYEAFWPDGAWAQWWNNDVFDTHYYEHADEAHELVDHSLLFWTAAAFCLPLIRFGDWSAPLVHCLRWGGGLVLTFLLLTLGGLLLTLGLGGLGLAEACLTFLLFILGVWSVILSAETCPILTHHRCMYIWSRYICVILSLAPPRGMTRRSSLGGCRTSSLPCPFSSCTGIGSGATCAWARLLAKACRFLAFLCVVVLQCFPVFGRWGVV